ncbi:MAG: hypothetical protein D6767_06245 [Candidatus Hydrogenedentota bacterium]|nr:MAG: hypothetical protein D6767_06245 [Candidatus Hydrogenedentota bacterium]
MHSSYLSENKEDLSSLPCGNCHVKAYETWKSSKHAAAYQDPIYYTALQEQKLKWCLPCHVPLEKYQLEGDSHLQGIPTSPSEGITCAVCHIRNGKIYGSKSMSKKESIHGVEYSKGLRSENLCAGCHQFGFPKSLSPVVYESTPMQNTVTEYKQSGVSKACHFCHIQGNDHSLHLGRKLSDSIQLKITMHNSSDLTFTIKMSKIGHHFPSGDLFRILTFYVYDKNNQQIYRYDFRKEVRVIDRELLRDSTLKPRKGYAVFSKRIKLKQPVYRCSLVYRPQGSIDPRLKRENLLPDTVLFQTIYDKPCKELTNRDTTK